MHYRAPLRRAFTQRTSRRRSFSTAPSARSNPYPFPNSPNPTPYQIFHLLPDASPADAKQRYYELVRLYHPDSAESRLHEADPAVRHARFSAITRAYASLQKRPTGKLDSESTEGFPHPWKRAPYMHRRRYEEPRFVDDRWKDRLIWGGVCFAIVSVAAQTVLVHHRRMQDAAERVCEGPLTALTPSEASSQRKGIDEDFLKLKGRRR